MQTTYYQKLSGPLGLAVLDLVDYYGDGFIITRINVPAPHRGKGIAHDLLSRCTTDADRTKTTLWLEIQSSDGLDHGQLEAWYSRHGFRNYRGLYIYRRRPQ